jgi:hypothetical protein
VRPNARRIISSLLIAEEQKQSETAELINSSSRDAPDFVEVGEAGIAVDDAMRRQHRVQLVAWRTWNDELQAQL